MARTCFYFIRAATFTALFVVAMGLATVVRAEDNLAAMLRQSHRTLEASFARSELDGARELLTRVASAIDVTTSVQISNATTQAVRHLTPRATLETIFAPDKGGVFCGGAAIFFEKLLQEFGIPAFNINMGISETHVTVLVPQLGPTGYKFYVFDPYMGFYHHDGVDYVDLEQLLAISRRGGGTLRYQSKIGMARTLLASDEYLDTHPDAYFAPTCNRSDRTEDGLIRCQPMQIAQENLVGKDFPNNEDIIIQLLSKKLISHGTIAPHLKKDFYDLLDRYEIPSDGRRAPTHRAS